MQVVGSVHPSVTALGGKQWQDVYGHPFCLIMSDILFDIIITVLA